MVHKAPSKYYRNGLSLAAVMQRFPDDARAGAWIVQQRRPDGVCCPRCESDNVQSNVSTLPCPTAAEPAGSSSPTARGSHAGLELGGAGGDAGDVPALDRDQGDM